MPTVLIVDDEQHIRLLIEQTLEELVVVPEIDRNMSNLPGNDAHSCGKRYCGYRVGQLLGAPRPDRAREPVRDHERMLVSDRAASPCLGCSWVHH